MRDRVYLVIKSILATVLVISLLSILSWYDSTYYINAKVYNVSGNIVSFLDSRDQVWDYCDTKNEYSKVQEVRLCMYDNHTSRISDDQILKIILITT